MEYYERTKGLIGEDKFNLVQTKRVLIVGLGGVGGTVFMSLVRSGVIHFHIIDFDDVEKTNLNRQVLYTLNDVGKAKVDVAKEFALSINPDIDIKVTNIKLSEENIEQVLDSHYDYICDAVDDVNAKVMLTKYATTHNIPLIVSTGAANKYDPTKIKISSLDKSSGDRLARKMRELLRKENIDISKINCAYSSETNENLSRTQLNSLIFVTSSMGLLIGDFIFKSLIK